MFRQRNTYFYMASRQDLIIEPSRQVCFHTSRKTGRNNLLCKGGEAGRSFHTVMKLFHRA